MDVSSSQSTTSGSITAKCGNCSSVAYLEWWDDSLTKMEARIHRAIMLAAVASRLTVKFRIAIAGKLLPIGSVVQVQRASVDPRTSWIGVLAQKYKLRCFDKKAGKVVLTPSGEKRISKDAPTEIHSCPNCGVSPDDVKVCSCGAAIFPDAGHVGLCILEEN